MDTSSPAAELAPAVRARMLALASQGLSKMAPSTVPAGLRIVASFAPARRVKLAGAQLVEAVEFDDDFREQLATQVRALVPELMAELDAGTPVAEESLVSAAAAAYIVRNEGWQELVTAANGAVRPSDQPESGMAATVSALTAQLREATAETRAVKSKLRAQVERLKADNAQLRRALGEGRTRAKEAAAARELGLEAADERLRSADAEVRSAQAEVRRLRAKITALEAESAAGRRASREERDTENMRLRLLLDTLSQTAEGMRRELALPPPSDLLPADAVPVASPGQAPAFPAGRALSDDDPVLLRRLLELPKVHLIVDGYNVSKEAWPTAPLDQQRGRLVRGVAAVLAGRAIETTIVFDGAALTATPPAVATARAVRVVFSPPDVTADDVIRQLTAAEPVGRPIVVVSTDREVAQSTSALGARAIASSALVRALP